MSPRIWQRVLGPGPSGHRIGRFFFLRGLGLVYLIAIASWWAQAELLVGEKGLTPLQDLLRFVGDRLAGEGRSAFLALPNLFWIVGSGDPALHGACLAGVLLALLVLAGRATGPALLGLWVIYLSLVNTGGVFMSFQWDILLLETGLLALFVAPWGWTDSWRCPPGPVAGVGLVLAWFLVAKLMFLSGWVKLAWASEANPEWWPAGTAMTYHYQTQPLPTWTAWWMHQLPAGCHRLSLVPMYLAEVVLPFAILLGRWGRLAAALGFAGLMLLIQLTGNYTYFNLLTAVLCLPLVHDRFWPGWLRRVLRIEPGADSPPADGRGDSAVPAPAVTAGPPRRWLVPALGGAPLLVIALLNLHTLFTDLHRAPRPLLGYDLSPDWLDSLAARLAPFHPVSGYGLFRTMTTERPEIILEGSADGVRWRAYDFAWKVDEIESRPRFVAPHQPRVAWQFWFAALEGRFDPRSRNAAWFQALVVKLLEGDRAVKALLERDPFPDAPPRFLRARLMRYEFTTPGERRETGDWWRRVVIGEYLPEVSLGSGRP